MRNMDIRFINDFPKKGIRFVDLTTVFKNPKDLKEVTDKIVGIYKDLGITKVVGVESRGFVISSVVAYQLGAGLVLCRKEGKLPCETISERYTKEYGVDTVEIHKDAINENDTVLIHDDILATGGTMKAVCDLVKKFNPKKIYVNFIAELGDLSGRNILQGYEVSSLEIL